MRLIGFFVALTVSLANVSAAADDLFIDGKPGGLKVGREIAPQTTIGGYPIYNDAEGWRLMDISNRASGAMNGAEPVSQGQVTMWQVGTDGATTAQMTVLVNIASVSTDQYMTGDPCGGDHLVTLKKSTSRDDNCLTVDVAGRGAFTFFGVRLIQTRSAGRIYFLYLSLGAGALGFPGTMVADWTPEAIKADANKMALLEKMTAWAKLLQEGSEKAITFSKPADAFSAVPSYRTLIAKAP
jgi:hypothetical protein